MNKRITLIILIAVLTVGLIGGLWLLNQSGRYNVAITISDDVDSVEIFTANEETGDKQNFVTDIDSGSTIRLEEGKYLAEPIGERVSSDLISFEVAEDTAVDINPDYSSTYNSQLINQQKADILAALNRASNISLEGYTIQEGKLHQQSDHYSTFITRESEDPREENDIYRVVLEKTSNGNWEPVAGPDLVLLSQDYPDVPTNVLSDVNNRLFTFDSLLE